MLCKIKQTIMATYFTSFCRNSLLDHYSLNRETYKMFFSIVIGFLNFDSMISLRKIPYFHLISWCGNFVKIAQNYGESPETMRKICLSTKFPHQEIRRNYGILCSVSFLFLLIMWNYALLKGKRVNKKEASSYNNIHPMSNNFF